APAYDLDVTGDIRVTGSVYAPSGGSTQGYWKLTGSSLYPTSTGYNVGIGTTSPQSDLQIGSLTSTSTASPITLSLGGTYSSTAGANPKLKLWDNGSSVPFGFGVSANSLDSIVPATGNFNWYVNGSQKMILNSSGYLGIGTTAPGQALDVNGDVNVGGGDLYLPTSRFSDSVSSSYLNIRPQGNRMILYDGSNSYILDIYGGTGRNIHLDASAGDSWISSGKVGIGITNPTQALTVTGSVDASVQFLGQASDTITAPSFSWTGDTNVGMYRPTTDTIAFTTAGTEKVRLTSGGYLGIGTTAPAQALTVTGSVDASVQFLGQASDTVAAPSFSWTGDTNVGIYRPATDTIAFTFSGIERIRMSSVGYLGIGTTAPLAPLNIISPSSGNQDVLQRWAYSAATNPDTGYNLKLKQTVTSGVVRWTFDQVNNGTAYPDVLTFDRGNVGIGTTLPDNQLSLYKSTDAATETQLCLMNYGTSANTATSILLTTNSLTSGAAITAIRRAAYSIEHDLAFSTTSSAGLAEKMRIDKDGHVGIGTSAPGEFCEISKVQGALTALRISNPTNLPGVQVGINFYASLPASQVAAFRYERGNQGLFIENNTSNGNISLVVNNGNVGIGTTTPAVKLDVNGDIAGDLISTGSTGYVGYVAGTGAGAYKLVRYSSSRRYKDNISGFDLGLDIVKKMRPVSFTWKSTGDRDFGFIAEEAEKVSPELITKINGQCEAFKYMAYTAVLTNAIQEQQKEIDSLKQDLAEIKKSLSVKP
ncbi:MAG: tail fiber domain-containing protein, partial [Candidatus Omnitrophota bacterium]